jgi:hypothetical protein
LLSNRPVFHELWFRGFRGEEGRSVFLDILCKMSKIAIFRQLSPEFDDLARRAEELESENRCLKHEIEASHDQTEGLLAARTQQWQEALADLKRSCDLTLEALGRALDLKDAATQGHCNRVAAYSIAIARKMGLPTEEIMSVIARGALLHEIGLMAIPDDIHASWLNQIEIYFSRWEEVLFLQSITKAGSHENLVKARHYSSKWTWRRTVRVFGRPEELAERLKQAVTTFRRAKSKSIGTQPPVVIGQGSIVFSGFLGLRRGRGTFRFWFAGAWVS